MKLNYAALGLQAIEALELVDSAKSDIKAAKESFIKAKAGCVHSRELVVAFVQAAAYAVQEIRAMVEDINRADLTKPALIGQALTKVDAVTKVREVMNEAPSTIKDFDRLIADIRAGL